MFSVEDNSSLARLFHLNSEPWLNVEAYSSPSYGVSHKRVGAGRDHVALPALPPADGLRGLLAARRSCRVYRREAIKLAVLGELLGGAFSFTRAAKLPGGFELQTRAAPSAGGLYPLELYVACRNIIGLPDGVYHYGLLQHCLEPVGRDAQGETLAHFLLAEALTQNANAIVFLTAVFDRTLRKYGPRGYRYILLEAGHVAQNLCLLAAERALGSLCIGGFMDRAANQFLRIDGVDEATIYGIAIGVPADSDETASNGAEASNSSSPIETSGAFGP
jgi:SagB-type dehydrogenase family enzyme